jgi:hypothetical protein
MIHHWQDRLHLMSLHTELFAFVQHKHQSVNESCEFLCNSSLFSWESSDENIVRMICWIDVASVDCRRTSSTSFVDCRAISREQLLKSTWAVCRACKVFIVCSSQSNKIVKCKTLNMNIQCQQTAYTFIRLQSNIDKWQRNDKQFLE